MKKAIHHIKKLFARRTQQEQLVEFILDEKIIDAAARGSMEKRNDLLQRVALHKKHI